MATTTNFGWETPDDTDLVKDGAAAMRTLGNSIDTSFVDLKGGTSGQILSKASNTDLDYTWITNDIGDITAVTAGTGLSGGGTSGAVTLSIDTATTVDLTTAQTLTNKTLTSPVLTTPTISTIDAKGDLLAGTADNTIGRRSVGANGTVLTADSAEATGMKWATPATPASGLNLVKTQTIGTAVSSVTVSDAFSSTYDAYRVVITGGTVSATNELILTIGAAASGYRYGQLISGYSSTLITAGSNSATGIEVFRASVDGQATVMDIMNPNLAKMTSVVGASAASGQWHQVYGVLNNTTSYTAFTLTTGSGTMTGGIIRVYGYQNS
jgi:hypothetical protein